MALLCHYAKPSDISKDNILVSTSAFKKVYNKEQLGPYFKEEKVNCGHSAPHTTTFLISKLKVIEHGVVDKKRIQLPVALKKAPILDG